MPRISWMVLCAMLALFPVTAWADAPQILPVQGHLSDGSGAPINDVFAVTFTLYSDAAGSQQVWTEETPVNFVDGYFTAYLGATQTIDLTAFRDNNGLFLGVKVADDEEMTPFELGTSPFAGFAQYAGFAADITDAAKVAIVGDVAVQLDNDGKVHDKYTDAEAIAAVTDALANDATQLEAALGTTDNSNALNHARYTDAEAVSAVIAADLFVTKSGDSTISGTLTATNLTVSGDLSGAGLNAQNMLNMCHATNSALLPNSTYYSYIAWASTTMACSTACANANPSTNYGGPQSAGYRFYGSNSVTLNSYIHHYTNISAGGQPKFCCCRGGDNQTQVPCSSGSGPGCVVSPGNVP